MKKRSTIIITIALILITVSVVFAYGNSIAANSDSEKKAALERMSEFDWSKTCPAASCRNHNEE